MIFRRAQADDADVLAKLNCQLIRDEGHRNSMSLAELTTRMRGWLSFEYQATVAEGPEGILAYALYRFEPEHIYIRQFFVSESHRRRGLGKTLFSWLRSQAFPKGARIRIDVLVDNVRAHKFWQSVGFSDYCITMEIS